MPSVLGDLQLDFGWKSQQLGSLIDLTPLPAASFLRLGVLHSLQFFCADDAASTLAASDRICLCCDCGGVSSMKDGDESRNDIAR